MRCSWVSSAANWPQLAPPQKYVYGKYAFENTISKNMLLKIQLPKYTFQKYAFNFVGQVFTLIQCNVKGRESQGSPLFVFFESR